MTDRTNELLEMLVQSADENKTSGFERHTQTVLAGVVLLIIGWVGFSILQMKDNDAAQNTLLAQMTLEINSLRQAVERNANPLPITRSEFTIHTHDLTTRMFAVEKEIETVRKITLERYITDSTRMSELFSEINEINDEIDELTALAYQLEVKVSNHHNGAYDEE